jgi:voltage-gated potassium channel Kch
VTAPPLAGLRRLRPSGPTRGLILVILSVAVIVLGTLGFDRQTPSNSPSDSAYSAVKLLLTDPGNVDKSEPTTLEIARWCGLLFAGLAVLEGLWLLFRAQWERARIFAARRHVVVAGLGEYGWQLARSFDAAGHQVVAVERDPANPAIVGCRERRIPVIVGDATDDHVIARAQVDRARYVIATCGDDAANVRIALGSGARTSGRANALSCFVHLDNLHLWPELKAGALTFRERLGARMEFFNVYEAGARILLDRHPPFPHDADGARVLVVGLDGIGESLVLLIAGSWRNRAGYPAGPLELTVVGPEAEARMASLVERHPQLDDIAALQVRDVPVDAGELHRGEILAGRPFDSIYVCLGREGDGVAIALALALRLPAAAPPVVLVVRDEESGLAAASAEGGARHVEPFGVLTRTLPPSLLVRGTNEVIARAKHEHYLRVEASKGIGSEANPSVVPWERLPESLKESNRAFADRLGPKLEATGCALAPNPLIGADANGFAFSDEEVEALGRIEHDGWVDALRRDGWQPGAEKDPERKLHPLLVPWEQLTDEERDKDRDPVRALPAMLAAAGFEILRIRAGSPDAATAAAAAATARAAPG